MGLDVDTHLVLGAFVQEQEIFVYSEHVPYKCNLCPMAHAAKQKFCGECGLKFKAERKASWTPTVLSYLKDVDGCTDPEDLHEYGSGPFFNVRAVQCSEDNEKPLWAVGVKFEGQSLHRGGRGGSIPWESLERAHVEVEVLVRRMGLSPREIKLYPVMNVSV